MSLHLDKKYVVLLNGRLEGFKRKSDNLFTFRCPYCGDSQTNKRKTRGNFYVKNGNMLFHCYNCEKSTTLEYFLKDNFNDLYEEYNRDKLSDKSFKDTYTKFIKKIEYKKSPLDELCRVSELEYKHPAYQYLTKRKLPLGYIDKIYYAPKFMTWINEFVETDKFSVEALKYDHPRLVIPLLSKDNVLYGLQGRALGKEDPKYITIFVNEQYPKIYGLDNVSYFDDIVAVEGPIDSMFLKNSIATCGGDITSVLSTFPKDKVIITYDNESRSKQTVKKIEKAIDNGFRVVIWPSEIQQKDINEMILSGLTSEQIQSIIKKNNYFGMRAKLELAKWKRC